MPTAVITDGEQRSALAIARSLGSAGYRCIVTSRAGRSVSGASRYVSGDRQVPRADIDPDGFARAVERAARDEQADLVIPVTETSLLAILPRRASVPARIPFPDLETFLAICDKKRVLDAAASVGIRGPRQVVIETPSQADQVLQLPLPVVLKPHRSVAADGKGASQQVGVSWVRDESELGEKLRQYPSAAYPLLAQKAVDGPGVGVFVLLHKGDLLASFSHRRIREMPPSGGVSVVRESHPMDMDLLERSIRLLDHFDWSGVAMVEYKLDRLLGEPVLMEINGRFWGSLQLAIDAGVDFPRILADVTLGRAVETVSNYRYVRSRWFWGDVDHLIARLRSSHESLRSRSKAVSGWLRAFGPGYTSEVFRWNDPQPFIRESAEWAKHVARL